MKKPQKQVLAADSSSCSVLRTEDFSMGERLGLGRGWLDTIRVWLLALSGLIVWVGEHGSGFGPAALGTNIGSGSGGKATSTKQRRHGGDL